MSGSDPNLTPNEDEASKAPRPGTNPSAPSGSHYSVELPYAEELQALLEDRYIVESFLGQGGMGAVYRGLQLPLKRPVAIKILQKQLAQDDFGFEERFKREAYAMASLTHPHIVQVYDCGDAGEAFLFISMELVEGGDLAQAIKGGQCTTEVALNLIQQICDGLQAAHERGIVHRDIKPANIFLTADGRAKVADFGLAKKFDAKSTFVTKTGLGMGTPDYAAPEQYEGLSDLDHRADIYALGVMFYQMLTGKLPRGAWQPPSKRMAIDRRLDGVVLRAMEQDRDLRYQSVAEMKADIQEILRTWSVGAPAAASPGATGAVPTRTSGVPSTHHPGAPKARPVTATTPHTTGEPASPSAAKKSSAALIAGIVGVLAIVAIGAFFMMKKPAPPATHLSSTSDYPQESPPAVSAFPSPSASAVPSGNEPWREWIEEKRKAGRLPSWLEDTGSQARATRGNHVTTDSSYQARNVAVRVTWTQTSQTPDVRIRKDMANDGRAYILTVRKDNVSLTEGINSAPFVRVIKKWPTPAGYDPQVEHTVELRAVEDQLTVRLDGTELGTVKDTALNNAGAVGLYVHEGTLIRKLEYADLGPSPALAAAPPPGSRPALQTLDLLALTDPEQDRIPVAIGNMMGANTWKRAGSTVEYQSDGKAGKIAAPVAFNCRDYEITLQAERTSGSDRLHMDVPTKNGRILPLIFNSTGRKVIHEKQGKDWGAAGRQVNVIVRVQLSSDGQSDHIVIQRNDTGMTLADWTGSLDSLAKSGEPHPSFPGQPVASVFCMRDGYTIKQWTLRVFEGEAKLLRGGTTLAAITAPQTFGGHRYQMLPDMLKWTEAKLKAESLGGHLATITSKEENDWVERTYISKLEKGTGLWLGGTNDGVVGRWRWLTGEPFVFTDWGDREPTNQPYEIALSFSNGEAGNLSWFDIKDEGIGHKDRRAGLLVEWDDARSTPPPSPLASASPSAMASPSPPPVAHVPPTAPQAAPAPSDPRVAQLEAGFKARFENEAQKPWLAAVAALDQSYVNNGIARARAAAQAKGSLDEINALDAEKTRIQNREPLPAADLDSLPEGFKTLRATYRAALAKINADRAAKAVPLYDLYLGALDTYISELTKASKIAEAQSVKAQRDNVAAQKNALLGDAPAPATGSKTPSFPAATPTAAEPPVPIPPEVLAPPPKATRTKELVEWLMSRNSFRVGYIQNNKRVQFGQNNPGTVPAGANLWLVDGGNQGGGGAFDPAWIEGETDLEQIHLWQAPQLKSLLPFRGLKKLQTLRLVDSAGWLNDDAMRFLPPLPELITIDIQVRLSNLGLRILCERCPKLQQLYLTSVQLAPGGFAPLARLKELRLIRLAGSDLPGADLSALATLPSLNALTLSQAKINGPHELSGLVNLTWLTVENSGLSNAEASSFAALQKLTRLDLSANAGLTDAVIPALATLPKLQELRMRACSLKDLGGAAMPVFPALTLLHIHGNPLGDNACVGIAKQKNLTSVYLTGDITDVGLQTLCEGARKLTDVNVLDAKVTDAGIPALRRLERLTQLNLSGTGVTDTCIETLKKIPTLTSVVLDRTQVTAAGIAELQKALPKCRVTKNR